MLKQTADVELLRSRIENWKFNMARQYLKGQPKEVKELVKALAGLVGNSGWFDGDLGLCVGFVADKLLGE